MSPHPSRTIARHLTPAALLAAALTLVPAAARGQTLATGEKVRITVVGEDRPVEAQILQADDDVLVLLSDDGSPRTVRRQDLRSLELSTRRGHAGTGAFLGGLAGVILGVALESAREEPTCDGFCIEVFDEGTVVALAGLTGAVVGGLTGAAVGALVRTESWVPVVSPAPTPGAPGRVELGVRWSR